MVIDNETKIQLDNLAKRDYYSDEELDKLLNSQDTNDKERINYYIIRRNYYRQTPTQRTGEKLQTIGSDIGQAYQKTKQFVQPAGSQLKQIGQQISQSNVGKIGKEINVSKYTGNSKPIRASMALQKPARMKQGSFNAVLHDGVRKFNDGFHSNRFARQNVETDSPLNLQTVKNRPNRQIKGYSTLIEGKEIPKSIVSSKVLYNPVNNKYNKIKWNNKWKL